VISSPLAALCSALFVVCLISLSDASPVVFNSSSSIAWDGDCTTTACTHASPCGLLSFGLQIWHAPSGSCELIFLGGTYNGGTYCIAPNMSSPSKISVTTEGPAVAQLNLVFGSASCSEFDIDISSSSFCCSSSISIQSASHALVNASQFVTTGSMRVSGFTDLSIVGCTISAVGVPPLLIVGDLVSNSTLSVNRSVVSSDVSLLYSNSSSSSSSLLALLTFAESSFSGPAFITGSQRISTIFIKTSLIVGISPFFFGDTCNASTLIIDESSIQGASSSFPGGLCPVPFSSSFSSPFQLLQVNMLSTTDFGFGELETEVFNIANSDFSDLRGSIGLLPSASSSFLSQNTFRRTSSSAHTLVIMGVQDPTQVIGIYNNTWATTPTDPPIIAFFGLPSAVVDFGPPSSGAQLIPSLATDFLNFTGTLWITKSIQSRAPTTEALIHGADSGATLKLSSISAENLHVNLTHGSFVYIPSDPLNGITVAPSSSVGQHWWLGVPMNVGFLDPNNLPSFEIEYPIAYNITSSWMSIIQPGSGFMTFIRVNRSLNQLSFTLHRDVSPQSAAASSIRLNYISLQADSFLLIVICVLLTAVVQIS